MPVHDCERDLSQVLPVLNRLGPEWEIIVVNDRCQRDPAPLVAELLPRALCLPSSRRQGASGARNFGASLAQGEILVFLDSDVKVEAEVLQGLVTTLEERPDLTGVFGCYSQQQPHEHSALSRFRNLLHRYVHRRCAGLIPSFWTALGAVRARAFHQLQGFDEAVAGIEDVEFGSRLARAGHRVLLEPRLQGIHLKHWTLSSMVRTDVLYRAKPWTRLILQGKVPGNSLNASWRFRTGPGLLLLTLFFTLNSSPWALLTGMLYALAHIRVQSTIGREGGWQVGLVVIPALSIHYLCCYLGAALAILSLLRHRGQGFHAPSALNSSMEVKEPKNSAGSPTSWAGASAPR